MESLIYLFSGLILGGLIATILFSCFQINKINEYEREIERLKNSNNNKSL